MAKVEVYTTTACPYCVRAKALLKHKGVPFTEIDVTDDDELRKHFAALADALTKNEDAIVAELAAVQGEAVDIGGYYAPDTAMTTAVMRPSKTLNAVLEDAQRA